ncbi:MAG: hypothetical protein ABIQ95_08070, partial [Bdellovibrionia bacterium]
MKNFSKPLNNSIGYAVSLALTSLISGCAGSSSTTNPNTAAVITANISGSISSLSATASGNFQHLAKSSSLRPGHHAGDQLAQTNTCDSGSFTGTYVGGGGTQVASGSFSGGAFTIPSVPVGNEMIVTFSCGNGVTQRCLLKSGDTGVSCNPIADAVI